MVERVDAKGKDYRDVLGERGRSLNGGSYAPVFYFDGDEIKGELNMLHLGSVMRELSLLPEIDGQSFLVENSSPIAGREAIVLSVPRGGESALAVLDGLVREKGIADPVSKPVPESDRVEQPDRYEGKRFVVTAWRKIIPRHKIDFMAILANSEIQEASAKRRAATVLHDSPDNLDVSLLSVSKETFFKMVCRDVNMGRYIPDDITFSDLRIKDFIMARRESLGKRKKPGRRL